MPRRTPSSCALWLLVVAVGASAGCLPVPPKMPGTQVASTDAASALDPGQPTQGPPIAKPGERMSYLVSLHGIALADLVLETNGTVALGPRDALVVEIRVDTRALASMVSAVHDRYTTWLDLRTGRPLRFHAQEAATPNQRVNEETEATFAPGQYPVKLLQGAGAGLEEVQVVHSAPFDFVSFLVFLRGWEGAVGSELVVDVMRSRFTWRARIVVAGHDNLVTAFGDLPVVRFEGEGVRLLRDGTVDAKSDRRRFTIWVSDDGDRVPVKLSAHTDYGDVRLELETYTAGR